MKGKQAVFEDFDISQNMIPVDQFQKIFEILADSSVHVERFRSFGCPTFSDEVTEHLAGWLAEVTESNLPYEMHLSDNAMTTDGFNVLSRALQDNDAFPGVDPKRPDDGKRLPMYLRLECNYINEKVIEKLLARTTSRHSVGRARPAQSLAVTAPRGRPQGRCQTSRRWRKVGRNIGTIITSSIIIGIP